MKYKKIIIGIAAGIFAVGAGIFSAARVSEQEPGAVFYPEPVTEDGLMINSDGTEYDGASAFTEPVQPQPVYVYVCGAVVSNGLYVLKAGDRLYDAVCAAGGMTPDADQDAVNLAAEAVDGQKVYIPYQGEMYTEGYFDGAQGNGAGLININTADAALLRTLPGIGEIKAADIIAYRTEYGNFKTVEEIMNVPGIKEAAFSKIKDLICIN